MGIRFRKSKNFGPFRVNVSKSGVSYSVGTKGARITKRVDGKIQTTTSIPGTGISNTTVHDNTVPTGTAAQKHQKKEFLDTGYGKAITLAAIIGVVILLFVILDCTV